MASATGDGSSSSNAPPPPDPITPEHQNWSAVKSAREKRQKHGAELLEKAGTSEGSFQVTFRIRRTDDGAPLRNLGHIHKDLLIKMFDAAPGLTLRPTAPSQDANASMISNIDAFPDNDIDHEKFFERKVTHTRDGRTSSVLITHKVHSQTSLLLLKKKLLPYLKTKDIFFTGGIFASTEFWSVGFYLGAHPGMVNRPELEELTNAAVSASLRLDEYRAKFAQHLPADAPLPRLYCHQRTINWGDSSNRVTTTVLSVVCPRNVGLFMKHVLTALDDDLPYEFIPAGLAQMTSPADYRALLIRNNDIQNSVQGISITAMTREILDNEYYKDGTPQTIKHMILSHDAIDSLEPTNYTNSIGRWIAVVYRDKYDAAKAHLQDLFDNIIPATMTSEERTAYREKNESYPTFFVPKPLGGELFSRATALRNRLLGKSSEPSHAPPPPDPSRPAWTGAIRFVFDDSNAFPPLPSDKSTPPSSPSPVTPKPPPAPAIPASSSSTVVSTDVETVVSKLESLVSSQFTQFQSLLEKQTEATTKQTDSMMELIRAQNDQIKLQREETNSLIQSQSDQVTKMIKDQSDSHRHMLLDSLESQNNNLKLFFEAFQRQSLHKDQNEHNSSASPLPQSKPTSSAKSIQSNSSSSSTSDESVASMTYESDSHQIMETERSPSATISDQKRSRSEISSTPPKEKKKKHRRRKNNKRNSNPYEALATDDTADEATTESARKKLDFDEAQDHKEQSHAILNSPARTATTS